MSLSRRNFLKSATATSVAFAGLPALAGCARADGVTQPWLNQVEGYGELVADPAGLFDLPEGFTYEVISTVGDAMTDGLIAPGDFDGMACFTRADGKWVLVRNHELNPDEIEKSG